MTKVNNDTKSSSFMLGVFITIICCISICGAVVPVFLVLYAIYVTYGYYTYALLITFIVSLSILLILTRTKI